jgi:Tol biopolymer transport system component
MSAREPGRLESWKEIGEYLQRDVRTLGRWEKEEGLPVHRHTHKSRSSVYAYRSEIDAWRASRKAVPEPAPLLPLWKTLLAAPRSLVLGITMALCLMMVGNGIRPQVASAQATGQDARQIWTGQQVDAFGSISADGRFLSFANWDTGDLGLRDLVTNTTRLLTNTGGWYASGDYAETSFISPDGSQIAYDWGIDKTGKEELRVFSVKDGAWRTLPQSEEVRYSDPHGWTPDGKEILVVRSRQDKTTQLAMVSARDGSARVLKSLGWQDVRASLSPDGRYIAYDAIANQSASTHDIFVLAADGSQESAVVQNPADDTNPVWSPDGSQILFLSDRTGVRGLWTLPINHGKPAGPEQSIKASFGGNFLIGMSRAGALFYSVSGSVVNIYTAQLDHTGRPIHAPQDEVETFLNHNWGPRFSPSGGALAFESPRGGLPCVVIRNLKTGQERSISMAPLQLGLFGTGPKWFPDEHSVLLIGRAPQRPRWAFYRLDLTSGQFNLIQKLTNGGFQAFDLSPDGKTLFFTEDANGDHQAGVKRIVRVDLASGQEKVLAQGAWYMGISVSPDNRQIAYVLSHTGGNPGAVYVMPAEGGPAREIYKDKYWYDGTRFSNPAWTPDGRFLLFSKGNDVNGKTSSIWKVPVSGGPAQVVLSAKGQIRSPQLASDGKALTFSANGGTSEIWTLANFLPQAAQTK